MSVSPIFNPHTGMRPSLRAVRTLELKPSAVVSAVRSVSWFASFPLQTGSDGYGPGRLEFRWAVEFEMQEVPRHCPGLEAVVYLGTADPDCAGETLLSAKAGTGNASFRDVGYIGNIDGVNFIRIRPSVSADGSHDVTNLVLAVLESGASHVIFSLCKENPTDGMSAQWGDDDSTTYPTLSLRFAAA